MKLNELLLKCDGATAITIRRYMTVNAFIGTVQSFFTEAEQYLEVKELKDLYVERIKAIDYDEFIIYVRCS